MNCKKEKDEAKVKVDLFHGDFTPYHASEIETLKKAISSKAK